MRRTIGAAAAVLVLVAAPAAAQRTARARVEAPGEGSVLSGTVDVRGAGESVAGVKRVELLVDSWSVAVKEPDGVARQAHADYSWDTTRWVADGSPAPNGRHTVLVQVTTVDGDTDKAAIEVVTDNPPSAPTGLAVAGRGSAVEVSWSPNPEPDITGYVVERDDGNGFVEVATTTEPGLDQTLVPGRYSYRVTAVRSSAVSEDGIASSPSDEVAVRVRAEATGGRDAVTRLGPRGTRHGGAGGLGASGSRAGLRALLSDSSLPDQRGLPPIPSPPGIPWGSYDEKLPYGKPAVVPPGSSTLTSARRPAEVTLLPADGLRWVAAGLLLLACAGLAVVTAARDAARIRGSSGEPGG